MSCFRRWGLPALLLSLPILCHSAAAVRAEGLTPPLDAKAVDTLVSKTLREVINEGADMYNAKGKYENQERDYLGCYHYYQGALVSTRPLLAGHGDLQKLIDDGLEDAAKTPRAEMRAFVLRAVIDKIRDGLKGETTVVTPPTPKETTATGKVVRVDKNKMTVSVEGKEQSITVPPEVRVVIDGKDGHIEDVKKDAMVTVALKGEVVTKVDVKNPAAPAPKETTFTGKVVGVDKNKITVNVEGKERSVTAPPEARVMIDGKDGKIEDVKKDGSVTITLKDDVVTKVEAKAPAVPLPPKVATVLGKVVGVDKDKLTVSVDEKERSFIVPTGAKVRIDEKDGKLADVKKDSSVTITSSDDVVAIVEVKSPAPPLPQTLWDRLGGEANVARVVDDFVNTVGKDPKVNFFRDPIVTPTKEELASLKKKLVEFVSSATGGPLKYDGKSMKETHKGMKITNDEFDASVADLKAALEKNGAKADDVKAVLAAVEGTRKDIVEPIQPEDKDKPKPTDKDKPGPDKDKPIIDKDKPITDKDKPVPDKDKPVIDKDKPVLDKDKPVLDKDKPKPTDKDKPAPDKDKPVLDKDKPVLDKDKPAPIDKDKPVSDKDKPIIDKDKPLPTDKDKPVIDKDKAIPADKDKPADAGAVNGKVSYKGKPVTGGLVGLTDAAGKATTVNLAADGTYKVEGVKAGKYTVTLSTEGLNDPGKPNPAYVPVPAVYRDAETSPLTVEVRKGDQTLDLNLAD